MQAGRHCSSALRIQWATILSSKESWGWESPPLHFWEQQLLLSIRWCVFKSTEGQFSNSYPRSEYECRPHPILHPTMETFLMPPLVKQACLVLMAFGGNLLTYSDLPTSPRFPSLSMILYWDFYNYLCLLHPYHICCRYSPKKEKKKKRERVRERT